MQTELTEAGRFEKRLTLTLDESELNDAKEKAARKLSQDMNIKGFRPGKAPRAVVERLVGAAALRSEAIDEALPGAVTDAIRDNELAPVTTPRVEDTRDRDDGGVEIDVLITMWPTLDEIPEVEGRTVEVELPVVEASEVDEQIERLRAQFAELEDVSRPADDGDFVLVNITALDGTKPIEQASANDLLYEVGSDSFIGGLDELVAGASAGDIRKGPGLLPPGFGDHEGEVTLSTLVKGVRGKKLPEVTDEWASDVTEFDTIEDLREQLESSLYAMKLSVTGQQFRDSLLSDLLAEIEVELPSALIEAEMEASLHNLGHSLEGQGLDLPDYLRITGQDQEAFLADIQGRATEAIKTRLLLESFAKHAEITTEVDELEGAVAGLAETTGEDSEAVMTALEESGQLVALAGDILRRKALNHILEQASPVDQDGEPVDLTPPGLEDEDATDNEDEEGALAGSQSSEDPDKRTAETQDSADE